MERKEQESKARSAAVNVVEYESEAMVQRFEPIRAWLEKETKDASLTAKYLAQLTGQLRAFQEEQLGRNAPPARPFTKLPAALFNDFEPGGSICVMLRGMMQLKKEQVFIDSCVHFVLLFFSYAYLNTSFYRDFVGK
jgi:hypothetical protein